MSTTKKQDQGEVDFNKLQKALSLPNDVVNNMREEDGLRRRAGISERAYKGRV